MSSVTNAPESTISWRRVTLVVIDLVMPIATVVMMVFFTATTASFLTGTNLMSIVTQNAHLFIVATLFAMLLMAGYVDLSVGSMLALVGVIAGLTFNEFGFWPGIVAGILCGAVLGAVNGTLVGLLGLSPVVVTLGGLAAYRGLAQTFSPKSLYGFPSEVSAFGTGNVLGVSNLAITAVIVGVIAAIIMEFTPIGRKVIAIGVNPRAAFLVGVNVKRSVFWLYVAVGVSVAVGALLLMSRLDSVPSGTMGSGFEVSVLTAVLLGGIPFTGGRGSLWRVWLGVWLIAILRNGLTLLNIGTEVAAVITGAVLVFAALLEGIRYYFRKK